jgi:hypothetical protein
VTQTIRVAAAAVTRLSFQELLLLLLHKEITFGTMITQQELLILLVAQ